MILAYTAAFGAVARLVGWPIEVSSDFVTFDFLERPPGPPSNLPVFKSFLLAIQRPC